MESCDDDGGEDQTGRHPLKGLADAVDLPHAKILSDELGMPADHGADPLPETRNDRCDDADLE